MVENPRFDRRPACNICPPEAPPVLVAMTFSDMAASLDGVPDEELPARRTLPVIPQFSSKRPSSDVSLRF